LATAVVLLCVIGLGGACRRSSGGADADLADRASPLASTGQGLESPPQGGAGTAGSPGGGTGEEPGSVVGEIATHAAVISRMVHCPDPTDRPWESSLPPREGPAYPLPPALFVFSATTPSLTGPCSCEDSFPYRVENGTKLVLDSSEVACRCEGQSGPAHIATTLQMSFSGQGNISGAQDFGSLSTSVDLQVTGGFTGSINARHTRGRVNLQGRQSVGLKCEFKALACNETCPIGDQQHGTAQLQMVWEPCVLLAALLPQLRSAAEFHRAAARQYREQLTEALAGHLTEDQFEQLVKAGIASQLGIDPASIEDTGGTGTDGGPTNDVVCSNACDLFCHWKKAEVAMHEQSHADDGICEEGSPDVWDFEAALVWDDPSAAQDSAAVLAVRSCFDYRAHTRSALLYEAAAEFIAGQIREAGCP
jgi:hypothetical protein